MSQRCFRSFWVRVPRKLKKAAKYGVKKHLHPAIILKCIVHRIPISMYDEKAEFLITGRCTKWKLKARSEIIKENKRFLAYMWQQECNRIIMW